MNKCFSILALILILASNLAVAQLEFNGNYEIEELKEYYKQAQITKDTANLGLAAFLLYRKHRQRGKDEFNNFDLLSLSIQCFKTTGDSLNFYRARGNLAHFYYYANQYEDARKIYENCYQYYRRTNNQSMQVHTLFSLGRANNKMGLEEAASQNFQQSLELNQVVKDTLIEVLTLMGLIPNQIKEEKLEDGLVAAKRMYDLSLAINRKDLTRQSVYFLGVLKRKKGSYDESTDFLFQVIQDYPEKKLSGRTVLTYKELAKSYEAQKDFEKAYKYASLHATFLDSLEDQRRAAALDELTLNYQSKEKEAAIQVLEKEQAITIKNNRQKNYLLAGLSLVLLALITLLVWIIRLFKEREKKDSIIIKQSKTLQEQRIKLLEDTVQLTAIQSVLDGQETERARIAQDLHDSLGGMLATVKLRIKDDPEKASDLLDAATQEIRMIAQNLQPIAFQEMGLVKAVRDLIYLHQQDNESPKITFQHYDLPERLDDKVALHFYRFIQEALHNALKHADAFEILIQINGEANGLSVMIEDDGKGFDIQQQKEGNGLQNFKKRAAFLNANLTIDSSKDGTTVYLAWEND